MLTEETDSRSKETVIKEHTVTILCRRYAWCIVNNPRCSLFVAIGFPSLSVKISSVPQYQRPDQVVVFLALGIQWICTLFAVI